MDSRIVRVTPEANYDEDFRLLKGLEVVMVEYFASDDEIRIQFKTPGEENDRYAELWFDRRELITAISDAQVQPTEV